MIYIKNLSISRLVVFALFAMLQAVCPAEMIPAITRPSADVTLSFTQPGRIAKIFVKLGDQIKAGDLLVQQDDALEQAQLAQTEALSKNTSQIQAGEASLGQRKVDLKKLVKAAASKAATELEVEHAKLDVKLAELSLEVAKFEHEQDKRKHEAMKIRVENMRLKSPIAGKVEKMEKGQTEIEVGESANALADIIRVVRTDPLWIDAPVPLSVSGLLKSGQTVMVEFPDAKPLRVEAKVTYVAAADAASNTLIVRVEVANKTGRPSGEHVKIDFSTR